MLRGRTHSVHFFSILQFSGHSFRNLKRSCIMLHTKPWEHSSIVATLSVVILLSARIHPSACCTVDSAAISTRRPGRQQLRLSNIVQRISRPNCELFYATNTSDRKQEIYLYEYPLHCVSCPQKRTTERCSSVVNTARTVIIVTNKTSLWTCACASAT
jgi:hypothetical protein